MKSIVIAGVFVAFASTAAIAQDAPRTQTNQQSSQMQQEQPGVTPTARMGDASKGGVSQGTSGSGTLMQQREQGMSPNSDQSGKAGSNSTGTMKQ